MIYLCLFVPLLCAVFLALYVVAAGLEWVMEPKADLSAGWRYFRPDGWFRLDRRGKMYWLGADEYYVPGNAIGLRVDLDSMDRYPRECCLQYRRIMQSGDGA